MADVRNNREQSRYEIFLDGTRIGLMTYRVEADTVVTPHTEIDPRYEGRGLGGQLVQVALDEIRSEGRYVRPVCPFVSHFISMHPEYQDLVKGS
jgi:predicted GNAT family acetyltransferase